MLSVLTKDLQKSTPHTAQNFSIPLVCTCLLHEATEKNLRLEGAEDLSDVPVRKGDCIHWRELSSRGLITIQ